MIDKFNLSDMLEMVRTSNLSVSTFCINDFPSCLALELFGHLNLTVTLKRHFGTHPRRNKNPKSKKNLFFISKQIMAKEKEMYIYNYRGINTQPNHISSDLH
jgi:hypothetical protein